MAWRCRRAIAICLKVKDKSHQLCTAFCSSSRRHSVGKVPVIAVVGKNEAEQGTVAIRRLGSQAQEVVSLDEAIRILTEEATPPDLRPA